MSGQTTLLLPSGGSITIAGQDSASNNTATLPATTGTLLTDQSNIETQTKAALNATGSAPVYGCRAWVNFNGTGTVAIRGSGNVSSITDNGTGDYTVNFAIPMPDANYCSQVATFAQTSSGVRVEPSVGNASNKESAQTTNSVRVYASTGNGFTSGVLVDMEAMYVAVFR